MDMATIEQRIQTGTFYRSLEMLVADFKTIFKNCRWDVQGAHRSPPRVCMAASNYRHELPRFALAVSSQVLQRTRDRLLQGSGRPGQALGEVAQGAHRPRAEQVTESATVGVHAEMVAGSQLGRGARVLRLTRPSPLHMAASLKDSRRSAATSASSPTPSDSLPSPAAGSGADSAWGVGPALCRGIVTGAGGRATCGRGADGRSIRGSTAPRSSCVGGEAHA